MEIAARQRMLLITLYADSCSHEIKRRPQQAAVARKSLPAYVVDNALRRFMFA